MVREAEASRARGLRGGELDVRSGIEFPRGRVGVGEDRLAVPSNSRSSSSGSIVSGRSGGGGEHSDTGTAP